MTIRAALNRAAHRLFPLFFIFKYNENMIKNVFIISSIIVILLMAYVLPNIHRKNIEKTKSASSTIGLTSKADWDAGNSSAAVDLNSSSGDIKLLSEAEISLIGRTTSASTDQSNKGKVIDGDIDTYWGENNSAEIWWKIDLGSEIEGINKMRMYNYIADPGTVWHFETSSDDNSYSDQGTFAEAYQYSQLTFSPTISARYIRIRKPEEICMPGSCGGTLHNFLLYQGGIATHTSASTQIGSTGDAARYVVEYQGFDINETEPANTTIDYRFQLVNSSGVSTSGWTAWASGDVANLIISYPNQLTITQAKKDAGETYLQVQSRLTSTDGVSTPTLSDYTVNYHTNKPPNTPVGE
ncbi:MAG: hypothetical protein CEN89_281 [Candidatus Berkelbacteria bacterium Licking1014_7]|uniref:F5/8 type C domain-containing protein n=1 Tax=Candidatus Berkelbacteria bacterium Licking1014_7 TaxID=2017147 RepID=A0A554LJJ5_9BACT|nr:MAG: hypothetical protein CEN89_281 [Candidatus Berkelbacteria bacterium Licking1014_7]